MGVLGFECLWIGLDQHGDRLEPRFLASGGPVQRQPPIPVWGADGGPVGLEQGLDDPGRGGNLARHVEWQMGGVVRLPAGLGVHLDQLEDAELVGAVLDGQVQRQPQSRIRSGAGSRVVLEYSIQDRGRRLMQRVADDRLR